MRFSPVVVSTLIFSGFLWVNAQAAPAPVVDLNDLPESNTDTLSPPPSAEEEDTSTSITPSNPNTPDPLAARQNLPTTQRLKLLEQQVNNLIQMNLPAKVDALEQQINQLNGEKEEQAHLIQQLQEQLQKQQNTLPSSPKTTLQDTAKSTSATSAVAAPPSTEDITTETPISLAETAVVQNKKTAAASGSTDEKAYSAAFNAMTKKQNTQAITAFKNFIKNYPNSPTYTPNAYYWLGELYSTTNQNPQAKKTFSLFIQQYPTHAKVPDAMLKLALMQDEAGEHAQAKLALQKIVQQFPQSSAAKLAKMRLKGMQPSIP